MKALATNLQAFTVIDLLVGVALLLVVSALLLPRFAERGCTLRPQCNNNLKNIGLAFKQASLDSNDRYPMQRPVAGGGTLELVENGQAWVHFQVISNELITPRVLICPQEKNRKRYCATTFAVSATHSDVPFSGNCNVSYFVGVDAADLYPNMWLAGDANFSIDGVPVQAGLVSLFTNAPLTWTDKRHSGCGNVVFADGSVRELCNSDLIAALCSTGDPTNRLDLP